MLWGCGSDNGTDGGGDDPTPPMRLLVNTSVAAPTLSSPDEAVWSSVDSAMVPVSAANTPKIVPGAKISAVPSEVKVQAIAKDDTLYVRLRWTDATHNSWPNYYYIANPADTFPAIFTRNDLEEEDQAYVLFDGAPGGGYDVWGWQALRTGGAGMGMGYRYNNNILTPDAAGTSSLSVAYNNPIANLYISQDTSAFQDYILTLTDAVHRTDSLRTDTVYIDTGQPPDTGVDTTVTTVSYGQTHGWTLNQRVPGWLIDDGVGSSQHTDVQRGSILDIRAADNHSGGMYSVVLKRAMNTGYADDLNLVPLDSVKVEIAIFDNQNLFTTGGTKRGVSALFWIIF